MTNRHDVSMLDTVLTCKQCGWSVNARAWGPRVAFQLTHAHLSRPDLPTEALLAFVVPDAS